MKKTPLERTGKVPTMAQRLAASAVEAVARRHDQEVKIHVEVSETAQRLNGRAWLALVTDNGETVTGETVPFEKHHGAIFGELSEEETPVLVVEPTGTAAFAYRANGNVFRFITRVLATQGDPQCNPDVSKSISRSMLN